MSEAIETPAFTREFINLAQPRLGAKAVVASDDFFAPCRRMLKPEPAVFIPGKYDEHGKWMDGWESRRKRGPGHDYCIVRLGLPGSLRGVDIDTSHFVGNHPPAATLDACVSANETPPDDTRWITVLPRVELTADAHHYHPIDDSGTYTHVRLNIYPDGGVARLRVYGAPQCDWSSRADDEIVDLVALENGGRALACSHAGFGSSMHHLNLPGRGVSMGDGWETPRRRGPGYDWVILALGHAGVARSIELDTAFYKGNYPDRASVQAARVAPDRSATVSVDSAQWPTLLPEQKLSPDAIHRYDKELADVGPVTHARINIFPDGGLSRIRLFGRIQRA